MEILRTQTPSFGATYSIRGYIGALDSREYEIITRKIRALGTKDDKVDIFIPNVDRKPNGNIGMAGLFNGKLRSFQGPYENGKAFDGIMKGLGFARNALFKYELNSPTNTNTLERELIPKHTKFKEFINKLFG